MGLLQTRALLGLLDAIGDRAERNAGQDRNDPDDHEEFHEGEAASREGTSGTTEV